MPIGGERFSDGGVGCGLPLAYLVDELKCTHILVVLNAPLAEENEPPPLYEKAAATIACRGPFGAEYRRVFRTRAQLYDEAVSTLHTLMQGTPHGKVAVVCPRSGNISRFVKDQATLRRLAEEGRSAVELFMNGATVASDGK